MTCPDNILNTYFIYLLLSVISKVGSKHDNSHNIFAELIMFFILRIHDNINRTAHQLSFPSHYSTEQ